MNIIIICYVVSYVNTYISSKCRCICISTGNEVVLSHLELVFHHSPAVPGEIHRKTEAIDVVCPIRIRTGLIRTLMFFVDSTILKCLKLI
jgi:hypothetical protein